MIGALRAGVLAGVLDGHASARLNQVLVREQQIAVSAGAGYDLISRGTSTFTLDGAPAEGRGVAELEAANSRADSRRSSGMV